MSDNSLKKLLHSQGVHNIGHRAGHHLANEGIKYVQSPQFQRQVQQFGQQMGQALVRIFR